MEKDKCVYIVTNGSYSAYSIEAVFDDEDKAREFCERENRESSFHESRVEVYPLNRRRKQEDRGTITAVKIDTDGKVVEKKEGTYWRGDYFWNYDDEPKSVKYIWGNSTKGYKAALKAARDKLNMLQAREENLI